MPILANNFPERLDRVLVYPTGIGYRAAWATFQWLLVCSAMDRADCK